MRLKYACGAVTAVLCCCMVLPTWAEPSYRTPISVQCGQCNSQYVMEKGINLELEKEEWLENTLEEFRHLTGKSEVAKVKGFKGSQLEAKQFARYIYRVWDQVGEISVYQYEMADGQFGVGFGSENPEQSYQRQKQVDEAVRTIGKMAEAYEGEARIAFINDWFMEHVKYRESYDQNTAYSALIDKVSACYGYARAFQAVCNYTGIECESIEGIANNQPHIWNRVKVDGQWKYIDVSWNSSAGEKNWYLIPVEEMDKSHKANEEK